MKIRKNPQLFEANALLFLKELSRKYKQKLTLGTIPVQEWKDIKDQGFDLFWAMGVWERSPAARHCALQESSLRQAYDAALPGWKDKDIPGSPYAVHAYALSPVLGKEDDLRQVRNLLNQIDVGLILDFVPNHMALDHPWTVARQDCFVRASGDRVKNHSGLFFNGPNGTHFAHGRDPYFPPWRDTVQVNFFSNEARKSAVETLLKIAKIADGVRCDMAMLGLNHVFEKTWGPFLDGAERPKKEFWQEVIEAVKSEHPDFIFMAEAYWDLEWELQQLGFDYTYDKKLYDRLLHASPEEIRGHLKADLSYQEHSVRFIENHDEPRAVTAFGREKSQAAAVITSTVPGLHFFYNGQLTGKKIHLPVQLATEPEESPDRELQGFYKILLDYINQEPLHQGKWQMLEIRAAGDENSTCQNCLSWSWEWKDRIALIVVNYSSTPSQARILIPQSWIKGKSLVFSDQLTERSYDRESNDLAEWGLYVDLGPWKAHLFDLKVK
ncbi:MAG TPA: alpha-amylase family glycosyl hydrolase [bacterium]|nr:alpha-amylase family glycosyl hydrolase [bacterium]